MYDDAYILEPGNFADRLDTYSLRMQNFKFLGGKWFRDGGVGGVNYGVLSDASTMGGARNVVFVTLADLDAAIEYVENLQPKNSGDLAASFLGTSKKMVIPQLRAIREKLREFVEGDPSEVKSGPLAVDSALNCEYFLIMAQADKIRRLETALEAVQPHPAHDVDAEEVEPTRA